MRKLLLLLPLLASACAPVLVPVPHHSHVRVIGPRVYVPPAPRVYVPAPVVVVPAPAPRVRVW